MRIRKQASKLLGWASCSSFPSSSSPPLSVSDQHIWPPLPSQSPEVDAGELHCQLNLSPWDAIESPQCTNFQAESRFDAKAKEEETEEKLEDKKGQARKRRGEQETEASGSGGIIKCKKTDGKGWHCKRLAQNPHSLCSYHLTQLRSYRARFEDQPSRNCNHRKNSSFAAADCGGAASNYYYYYSILGPWWGRRRGAVNERSEDCDGKTENEAAAVDGDDDDEQEEEEEEEEEDGGEVGCMKKKKKKKKKKRVIKRRGRKPVKARSLKSLL